MNNRAKEPLTDSIESYLRHKHALGKQLVKVGPMLYLLDGFLLAHGVVEVRQITPGHISDFVASRHRHSPRSYNVLIGALRGPFDWMVVHEILLDSPLRCEIRRVTTPRRPFLFDIEQAQRLLKVAAQLPSNSRAQSRGETYKMIFALLYGLGLRVGEVSRLCRKDVDLDNQLLIIRQTKFGKDRLVPFGPKMASEINGFLQREESLFGQISPDSPVFSFYKRKRKPIGTNTISWAFHKLLPKLQLVVPPGVASPHLHCLRHSFAVGTLLRWYREGVDPMSRLFDLSTFLGHVSPSSTAVYLTITTELLECASTRFALFASDGEAILDHQIHALFAADIREIGIVVGYESEQIIKHVETRYRDHLHRFCFIHNPKFETTNNIYSLWVARDWLRGEAFMCLNADVLCEPDILIPAARTTAPISMVVDPQWREETMKVIIRNGCVAKMSKKIPRSEFSGTYIGITTFSVAIQRNFFRSLNKLVAGGHVTEFFNVAVQELADRGVKVGFTSTRGLSWAEIDDPADLAFAREHVFPKLAYAAAA